LTGAGAGAAATGAAAAAAVFLAGARLAGVAAELIVVICVTEEFFYSIKRGGNTYYSYEFSYQSILFTGGAKNFRKMRKKNLLNC
jgi:hypothetical protein